VALQQYIPKRTWPLLAAGVGIAATVWGIYAWQFSKPSESTNGAPKADKTEAPSRTIPLEGGADEESVSGGTTTAPAGGVRANAPVPPIDVDTAKPSPGGLGGNETATADPIDITIGQIHPEQAAAAETDLRTGKDAIARGELLTARTALSKCLDRGLPAADEDYARKELARIADVSIFSKTRYPGDPLVSAHTVVVGDSMAKIVAPLQITPQFAARINKIADPQIVRLGASLKLVRGPFNAVIDKSDHRLDVYLGDIYVRSYKVGLGMEDGTPTGIWQVRNKLVNPEWTDPNTGHRYLADDPDNPIGERWIGLLGLSGEALDRSGFGIHGTNDPTSIGKNASMGCVRLLADDIEWVFDLLVENKSRVVIRP